jgi:hypothetical protein
MWKSKFFPAVTARQRILLRTCLVAVVLCLFVPRARAQSSKPTDTPLFEQTFAYSYLSLREAPRANNFSGVLLSGVVNQNTWLGWVGELGLYQKGVPLGNERVHTYMAGPRFTIRHPYPFSFFGQVMFGPFLERSSKLSDPALSGDSLAISAGLGADLRINHRIAIRLIQADYLRTDTLHSNPRLATGIVFRFGRTY